MKFIKLNLLKQKWFVYVRKPNGLFWFTAVVFFLLLSILLCFVNLICTNSAVQSEYAKGIVSVHHTHKPNKKIWLVPFSSLNHRQHNQHLPVNAFVGWLVACTVAAEAELTHFVLTQQHFECIYSDKDRFEVLCSIHTFDCHRVRTLCIDLSL